jgi:DNA-directed RNA polymerase subunit beta'
VVTEVAGNAALRGLHRRRHRAEQTDDVTGLASHRVVIDPKQRPAAGKDLRPMVKLLDEDGEELNIAAPTCRRATSCLRGHRQRQRRCRGRRRRHPRAYPAGISKTRDITGGLPRVADLFEARKPKEPALLAEATGTVSFGKDTKGKQRLVITTDDGETIEELIPKWRHVNVFEGERVERARSSPRASSTRTTSCASRASRHWPSTWSRRSRTSTACRA